MRPQAEFDLVQKLISQGLNNCQIARATRIPIPTVWRWRNQPTGSSRGRETNCPICREGAVDPAAYAYLLGLYLGDGTLVRCARDVYRLEISLDAKYPAIIDECARTIGEMRSFPSIKAGTVNHRSWITVYAYWKHWPCLFPQHGRGPKHLRRIVLERWQEEIVEQHPARLLRGLIHSDGSRGLNYVKGKGYPRYQFTNASDDIRKIFCKACDDFHVRWRKMNARNISIARREDVAKLDAIIGPKT